MTQRIVTCTVEAAASNDAMSSSHEVRGSIELMCIALANLRAVDDPRWSVRSLALAWQAIGWWGRFRRAWWDIGNRFAGVDPSYGSNTLLALPVTRLGPLESSQVSHRFERPFKLEEIDCYPYPDEINIERVIVDDITISLGRATTYDLGRLRTERLVARRYIAIALFNPSRWNAVEAQISIRGVTLTREVSPFDWRRTDPPEKGTP